MVIDLDTYIISDTHFGHDNIIRFCNRPANHDELMRERWLATVRPEDTILHLGDVGFGKKADLYLEDLPGRKLLIKGNHDKKADAYYESFGFEILETPVNIWLPDLDPTIEQQGYLHLVHDPAEEADLVDPFWCNDIVIHGHIHNNGYPPECPEHIDYRNVSVELMDYRPVRLRDILYGDKYQSRKAAGINSFYLEKK